MKQSHAPSNLATLSQQQQQATRTPLVAVVYDSYMPLDHGCSLFARKFDGAATGPVLRLARDCDYGLGYDAGCVLQPPPVESEQTRVVQYQKVWVGGMLQTKRL